MNKRTMIVMAAVLGLAVTGHGQEDDAARTARLKAQDAEAFQAMRRERVSVITDRKIEIDGNQETLTALEGRHWLAGAKLRAKWIALENLWLDDIAQAQSPKYHTRMESFRVIYKNGDNSVAADVTVSREEYPDLESIKTACTLFLAQARELEAK